MGPNSQFVRSYFGCEGGKLKSGETCLGGMPIVDGKPLYPLPKSEAEKYYAMGTTAKDSCNCAESWGEGPGCYVATSIMMLGKESPIANMIKISGTCPQATQFDLV